MVWIGHRGMPDSACDQNVSFDGCLIIFNNPDNPDKKYKEMIQNATSNAYSNNFVVFFLYDNSKTINPPEEWVDLLEHSYVISPLQAICSNLRNAILPFSIEERQKVLSKIADEIFKFSRVKITRRKIHAIGVVTIEGKSVSMPLVEIN